MKNCTINLSQLIPEESERKKSVFAASLWVQRLVLLLHIASERRREQINVCCANKSFLNFPTRNFHYIDCFQRFFPPFHFDFPYGALPNRYHRAIQKRKLKNAH